MKLTPNLATRARTIEDTCACYGWSRTFVYQRLQAGELVAIKAGRRTLVTSASSEALFASLPPASFRAPRQKAAA